MVVLVVGRIRAVILRLAHVELATKDGLDAFGLRRLKKMHRAVDVPVVGHGHGFLAQRRHAIDEFVHVACAVEQGILSVQMEMGEFGHG